MVIDIVAEVGLRAGRNTLLFSCLLFLLTLVFGVKSETAPVLEEEQMIVK